MSSIKSTTFQKLKIAKIVRIGAKYVSEHCASFILFFSHNFFSTILRILNNHISKTKNQRINFSFILEHCASFWTEKNWPLLRGVGGGGVCMSLTRTGPDVLYMMHTKRNFFLIILIQIKFEL